MSKRHLPVRPDLYQLRRGKICPPIRRGDPADAGLDRDHPDVEGSETCCTRLPGRSLRPKLAALVLLA